MKLGDNIQRGCKCTPRPISLHGLEFCYVLRYIKGIETLGTPPPNIVLFLLEFQIEVTGVGICSAFIVVSH